jgi:hypothetical protein
MADANSKDEQSVHYFPGTMRASSKYQHIKKGMVLVKATDNTGVQRETPKEKFGESLIGVTKDSRWCHIIFPLHTHKTRVLHNFSEHRQSHRINHKSQVTATSLLFIYFTPMYFFLLLT